MFHDYFVFIEDRGTGDGMCAAHLINMACAKVMHTTVAVHLTGRCVSVRHIYFMKRRVVSLRREEGHHY